MDAYPDAKVLLTLHPRGAEAWYESIIETIYFTENVGSSTRRFSTPLWAQIRRHDPKLAWVGR